MKLLETLKLYKRSIYHNKYFILICFCIFTFSILLDSLISSKEAGISELQLTYNNLSLYRQGVLYIPLCTMLTMKLLEFTDHTFLILRLGSKNNIWNQIILHILITHFMISLYLVTTSYISGLFFTSQRYMAFHRTLILLVSLVLLYTIGLSLFTFMVLILKMITGNRVIAYMALWVILVPEVLNNEGSFLLSGISFSMRYLSSYIPALFNIFKFGGITILIIEWGRRLYERGEIYHTKKYW